VKIVRDSREQHPVIKKAIPNERLLEIRSAEGDCWSFDFLLELRDGTPLKTERKAWADAVGSFRDGKLDRQCSYVDLLIVEMGLLDYDPSDTLQRNTRNHIDLLSLHMPVIITDGPLGTLEKLHWLAEREGGLKLRINKASGVDYSESARQGILRSVLGRSGHSVDRETAGGRIGDQLENLVDWQALSASLNLGRWPEGAQWNGRTPSQEALEKIRARLASPSASLAQRATA
jgi:hypothetical protein